MVIIQPNETAASLLQVLVTEDSGASTVVLHWTDGDAVIAKRL